MLQRFSCIFFLFKPHCLNLKLFFCEIKIIKENIRPVQYAFQFKSKQLIDKAIRITYE